MLKYIITIIIFAVVVFIIKVVFPIYRFYILVENIVSTYEMITAVILKAKEKEIENLESKPIVLRYGKYSVTYNNLYEAYDSLAKHCEYAINCAEKLEKFLANNNDYEQRKWQITNIYNNVRSELWKNTLE